MQDQIDEIYLSAERRPEDYPNFQKEGTDVIVVFTTGQKYTASFFTYTNIQAQQTINKNNPDFLNGKFFWVKNMFVVDSCEKENITLIVDKLIEEGEFYRVFSLI